MESLTYIPVPCKLPASGNRQPNEPVDPARVSTARAALLRTLDSVARQIPGDRWVAGQRVWYLTFSGALDRALDAATSCGADASWCQRLRGYVLVREGRLPAGIAAFDSARAAMAPQERCAFDDVSLLMDDDSLRARYTQLPCSSPARQGLESRLWWLADPSWLVPGNDRRAEHDARMVDREITEDWGGTICGLCRDGPLADAITTPDEYVRTGANTEWIAWTREYDMESETYVRGATMVATAKGVAACGGLLPLPTARFHFVPDGAAIASPLVASPRAWNLDLGPPTAIGDLAPWNVPLSPGADDLQSFTPKGGAAPIPSGSGSPAIRATQSNPLLGHTGSLRASCNPLTEPPERFSPAYAAVFKPLPDHQSAFFRLGDSATFVTVVDGARDTSVAALLQTADPQLSGRARAELIAYWKVAPEGLPAESLHVAAQWDYPKWIALTPAPWDSMVVGFEVLLPPARNALVDGDSARSAGLLRTRFGIAPPSEPAQRVTVSDVAFYDPQREQKPTQVDGVNGVLPVMLGTTALSSTANAGKYGVFWEVYGIRPGESEAVAVTLSRTDGRQGVFSRLLHLFGGGSSAAIRLQWKDQAPTGVPADSLARGWGRAVVLGLGTLPQGHYRLRTTVVVPGQLPITVDRAFSLDIRDER